MNLRVFYLTRRGLSDGYENSSLFVTIRKKKDISHLGDILSFVFRFVLFE